MNTLKQRIKTPFPFWQGVFLFFTFNTIAIAELSSQQKTRFAQLTHEVRCVVCQNQSLADSSAPLAQDLREKIHALIADNKTDDEIKTYLVKRYGEFVLLRPRFNKLTYGLWLFPLLSLLYVAWFFISPKKKFIKHNSI